MSVLIKGMEMPALCQECDLYIEGACYAKGYRDYQSIMNMSKPDDCPLTEIPTPHGRLIDIKSVEEGKFVKVSNGFQRWWNGALESVIDNAPTVIEAED